MACFRVDTKTFRLVINIYLTVVDVVNTFHFKSIYQINSYYYFFQQQMRGITKMTHIGIRFEGFETEYLVLVDIEVIKRKHEINRK